MSLTLRQIALREITLHLKEPFRISSGVASHRRILLVELTDADGTHVWAECVAGEAPNYSPETVDTAWLAIREWVAPRVLGRTFENAQNVFPALEQDFRGHRMAKAAVEMGMWALAATRAEQSLSRFLGGTRQEIATGISLGIQESPAKLVEKARAAQAQGYRKIKLKIQPGSDVAFVAAVREALGPDAPLMADANNAYTLAEGDALEELDRSAPPDSGASIEKEITLLESQANPLDRAASEERALSATACALAAAGAKRRGDVRPKSHATG